MVCYSIGWDGGLIGSVRTLLRRCGDRRAAVRWASGQKAIWMVHKVSGIPFAEKKHEKMRGANPFLGIVSDFASRPGFVEMRVKKSRKEKLLHALDLVLERKELTGAQAASLRGKLYFTSLTAFGGVGRAPLQVLAK